MGGYYYYDNTYLLVLIGAVICLLASARVNTTFNRYAKVRNYSGLTGQTAAEQILRSQGIYDVRVERVSGNLTDHYDPRTKVLRLSDTTYGASSVAAVGVAAHECGHAVQDATGYFPLILRRTLVPVANFGSMAAWPLIIIGLFIHLGIIAFSASVLFQLVTLPVEFNASRRAVKILESTGMLNEEEVSGTKKVLKAAALTYVAGAAASILQLLRLIAIGGRRRGE